MYQLYPIGPQTIFCIRTLMVDFALHTYTLTITHTIGHTKLETQ